MKSISQSARSGFTLVELMVVIFIIALIIGISVPAISMFMKGKSLENAGQIVQTTMMLARRATVTKKIKHRVIFFGRNLEGRTVYGVKIYRSQTPYDESDAKPGEGRGGYLGKEYLFPNNVTPYLMFVKSAPYTPPATGAPDPDNIKSDRDGSSSIRAGALEFQKNGTLNFLGDYNDRPSFDLEHILKDGDKIPSGMVFKPNSPNKVADIIFTQKASNEMCYIDLDQGGRAYVRILQR